MTDVLRSIKPFLPRQRSRRPAKPLDILLAAEAMTPFYEAALRLPANRRCVCRMPCLMEPGYPASCRCRSHRHRRLPMDMITCLDASYLRAVSISGVMQRGLRCYRHYAD